MRSNKYLFSFLWYCTIRPVTIRIISIYGMYSAKAKKWDFTRFAQEDGGTHNLLIVYLYYIFYSLYFLVEISIMLR